MIGRTGKKKALIAIARKILVSSYYMILKEERYIELGASYLDEMYKERSIKYHRKRLEALGYEVEMTENVG